MKFWTLTAAAIVSAATVTAAPPTVPQTPVAVQDILFAQPFTLAEGYQFDWSKERPMVTSGQLVVFQVNPDLVYPRQSYEPVLYVGTTSVERLNVGYTSGRVIAIVPDTIGADGKLVRQDLSKAWFGQPNVLPGDVTTAIVAQEADLAAKTGVQPLSADKVSHARLAGGEAAKLSSKYALLGLAAKLVNQFAPDEVELAENFEHTSTLK
ncbi:MAG: hypothetical protein IT436_06635 [Phycisphaerales bacterium]|nr:hypothetical protein [Phycisphaerales bacterium]